MGVKSAAGRRNEIVRERAAKRKRRQMPAFFRNGPYGPYDPLATSAEVLEVNCPACSAGPGQPCNTAFPYPSILGMVMPELTGIHTRRYLDRTHDPR